MNTINKTLAIITLSWLASLRLSGQTTDFLNKQADGYFNNKQFTKALFIYQQLLMSSPQRHDLLIKRAICDFETNHLDSAEFYLKKLLFTSREELDLIHFIYGKILMSKGEFDLAIRQLKKSLNFAHNRADFRAKIIDDIKRCGAALSLPRASDAILIEAAGMEVNTEWDEINPIPSINMDSKFYFNSNREVSGLQSNYSEGFELAYDMYSSTLQSGEWSDINALNPNLSTKNHELLADFEENGQILYFRKGEKMNALDFVTDTFNRVDEKIKKGKFDAAFLKSGDDIHLFTNDILIFSSRHLQGFGGFDLYYSKRIAGGWSDPVNLGKDINTPYDEISPYLAFDGRTLFFSSNNLMSMGGFDLFYASFDDKSKKWTTPSNMGTPLNSSEDEKHFRLNKSRLSGLFSSNRKIGIGGFDIYLAYFRQALSPQLERSRPIFFGSYDVPSMSTSSTPPKINAPESEHIVLPKPMIYYESDDQLTLPAVTQALDQIGSNLQKNQLLNVLVEVFSDYSGAQDLIYSIKRAESIKTYLANQGVKPSRITVKGYGSGFPLAKESLNDEPNPAGKSLNRRIEFTYFIADPTIKNRLSIHTRTEAINPLFTDQKLANFRATEQGINYKVLLVSASNPSNLDPYIKDTPTSYLIEKNNINSRYELLTRGYATFEAGHAARKQAMADGFEDAIVLAYFENQRLQNTFLTKWAEIFPEVLKYIYRSE